MDPYGTIWARMGSAWALEEREKLNKNGPFVLVMHFYWKDRRFLISRQHYMMVLTCSSAFWPKYVSEWLWITSKSKFSNQSVQFSYLRHPASSNSLHGSCKPATSPHAPIWTHAFWRAHGGPIGRQFVGQFLAHGFRKQILYNISCFGRFWRVF